MIRGEKKITEWDIEPKEMWFFVTDEMYGSPSHIGLIKTSLSKITVVKKCSDECYKSSKNTYYDKRIVHDTIEDACNHMNEMYVSKIAQVTKEYEDKIKKLKTELSEVIDIAQKEINSKSIQFLSKT